MLRLFTILTLLAVPASAEFAAHDAPQTAKKPKDVTVHGDPRTDDYFWLREKENPAVIEHLRAENLHTEAVLAPAVELRKRLYSEIVGRMKETDSSAPAAYRGWLWYERMEKGKQHPFFCRRKDEPGAAEQVVLDVNKLAEGKDYTAVEHYQVSASGARLLYSVDWTGYREYEVTVLDLATLKPLPHSPGKVSGITWAGDDDTLYFTTENEAKRSDKAWRFHLSSGKRELMFEEKDELFDLGVYASADDRFVFISSRSKKTAEVRAVPAGQPDAAATLLLPRVTDIDYSAEHRDGRIYFVTNKDAKNFRMVSAPVAQPAEWTEVIPHNPAVKLDTVQMFAGFMALLEREGGLPQVRLYDFATGKSRRLEMPEAAYEVTADTNMDYRAPEFRFAYESMLTPPSVRAVNGLTGEVRTLKNKEVPGYDPAKYKTLRVMAPAADGVRIPLSIVHRTGLDRTKPQPLHLYGYGSYGISEIASFSSATVSLLDRGMIHVTAHIRGGGEMGEEWRDAGRMERKMTTFTDFVSCAEFLVREKWTTPQQLAISGGSAGGMLVGAVLNLRPDLFQAAILDVPFVDVLNTMLDDTLPLTTSEYVEWGNPNLKEQYAWMRAYSPYDNLRAAAYPHVLVNCGLNDSQVPYWEGAKYAAKLRAVRTDKNVTLLHCDLSSGHGGASGRYDSIKEVARNYAFLLNALGLADAAAVPK
jgi:oligopeptidase B